MSMSLFPMGSCLIGGTFFAHTQRDRIDSLYGCVGAIRETYWTVRWSDRAVVINTSLLHTTPSLEAGMPHMKYRLEAHRYTAAMIVITIFLDVSLLRSGHVTGEVNATITT